MRQAARLDLASGEKYNYGYRKNRLPDTEIASGAVLSINLNSATGLQNAPSTAANMPHFKVFTGGGCSQGKIINVQKDGLVQIGDPNSSKSGELNLLANSIMTVKSGATLRISKTSALIVQEGARLIIEQGAKVILSDPNSELRIEVGVTLELLGQLDFSGEGYWHFAGDNEPIYGPDMSTWWLEGIEKGRRMLKCGRTVDIFISKVAFMDLILLLISLIICNLFVVILMALTQALKLISHQK